MTSKFLIAFGIMGVCLVMHVSGILLLGEELVRHRKKLEDRIGVGREGSNARATGNTRSFLSAAMVLISVFTAMILLHIGETAIWAVFYLRAGLFPNFEASLHFSLQSFSTVGYGDLLLPQGWRLLGTIEGIAGTLLSGLSAAFLFAIITILFRIRIGDNRDGKLI